MNMHDSTSTIITHMGQNTYYNRCALPRKRHTPTHTHTHTHTHTLTHPHTHTHTHIHTITRPVLESCLKRIEHQEIDQVPPSYTMWEHLKRKKYEDRAGFPHGSEVSPTESRSPNQFLNTFRMQPHLQLKGHPCNQFSNFNHTQLTEVRVRGPVNR